MNDHRTRRDPDPARNGPSTPSGLSRRSFMQTLGVSAAASTLATRVHGDDRAPQKENENDGGVVRIRGPKPVDVTLRVNGHAMKTSIEPSTTLLDALRFHLDLTGPKEICNRGACGGCSVLLDGTLIASCMMLALDAEGSEITTIEGISQGNALHPIQESFIRHDAQQCGYCTPGLILAVKALLNERPKPSLEEIRQGLSGNICRCGTYTNVFNAVLEASGQPPVEDTGARR